MIFGAILILAYRQNVIKKKENYDMKKIKKMVEESFHF